LADGQSWVGPKSLPLLRISAARKLTVAVGGAVALLLVGAPASWARTHATPTPSPTPTPVADPAVTKIARQQFVQWQAGLVNKSLYAAQLQAQLTDAKIADTSSKLGELGALNDTVFIGRWLNPEFPPEIHGYIYQMRCISGNVYLWLAIDGQGKIAALFFKDRLDVENVTPAPSATPSGLI
jgi:hypothetical protein